MKKEFDKVMNRIKNLTEYEVMVPFPKEFELLRSINFRKKLIKEVKPRGPAANSDHYYFTEAGVPAFFIYTMGPNKHYHDVEDRYEALSFDAFDKVNSLLLKFLKEIK